jgi:hypothetical protein
VELLGEQAVTRIRLLVSDHSSDFVPRCTLIEEQQFNGGDEQTLLRASQYRARLEARAQEQNHMARFAYLVDQQQLQAARVMREALDNVTRAPDEITQQKNHSLRELNSLIKSEV